MDMLRTLLRIPPCWSGTPGVSMLYACFLLLEDCVFIASVKKRLLPRIHAKQHGVPALEIMIWRAIFKNGQKQPLHLRHTPFQLPSELARSARFSPENLIEQGAKKISRTGIRLNYK